MYIDVKYMIERYVKVDKLNRDQLYRYLGYKGNTPDEVVRGIVDKSEEYLVNIIKPAYVWNVFDIKELLTGDIYNGIEVVGTSLVLKGQSIRKHLTGCDKIVLLCATLSMEADKLIRQTEVQDMARALIVDAAASVAIEQVCDMAEKQIKESYPKQYMTYRYGVGYGDLPLEHEGVILDILSAGKYIGLYCSDANILTPRKSVVCMIGLSDNPLPVGQKGCATCNMNTKCSYRKQGLNCGY